MRSYIDNALIWDFILTSILGTTLILLNPITSVYLKLPTAENLNSIEGSLISVSATLIGFLLTIITVIVTFKSGFEEKQSDLVQDNSNIEVPQESIFEKKIPKENKFYGTIIHKRVVDVFVSATYEIGIVLLLLIFMQFNVLNIAIYETLVVNICFFIIILISIVRSLFIFKLFLNVHLHQKSLARFN